MMAGSENSDPSKNLKQMELGNMNEDLLFDQKPTPLLKC
jgi:hypothetical protein